MALDKFDYLYSKPLGNRTLMKKYLEIYFKKTWKYHGILSVRKSGNPAYHMTYPMMHVMYLHPPPPPPGQDRMTDGQTPVKILPSRN